MTTDLRAIAHALGGEVGGGQVLAPGPGHSSADRSLAVRLEPTRPVVFWSIASPATTGAPASSMSARVWE